MSDLDPNRLTQMEFLKKFDFEKKSADNTKSTKKYPAQRVNP